MEEMDTDYEDDEVEWASPEKTPILASMKSSRLASQSLTDWHLQTEDRHLKIGGWYTAGEVVEYIGVCRLHYRLVALLGACALVHGMDTTFYTIVPMFAGCNFNLSLLVQSLVSVVYLGGLFCGSLSFGLLSDMAGRKTALIGALFLLIAISCLILFAFTPILLFIFRFVSGFAIGGLGIRTTWMFECLPNETHQVALMVIATLWQLGMMLELPILLLVGKHWAYAVIGIHVPLVAVAAVLMLMPESPRFLGEKKLFGDAYIVLEHLARERRIAIPEINLITEEEKTRREQTQGEGMDTKTEERLKPKMLKFALTEMLRAGDRRKTTCLLAITWFAVFFCFFGHHLATIQWFELLDFRDGQRGWFVLNSNHLKRCIVFGWKDYVALLLISTSALPGLLIFMKFIKRSGRRRMLWVTTAVAGGSVLPLVFMNVIGRIGITVVLSIQRAAVSAAVQILLVYTPELYPTHLRGFANGALLSCGLLGAMLSPFVSMELLQSSTWIGTVLFGAAFLGAVVSSYNLPVESHGELLED